MHQVIEFMEREDVSFIPPAQPDIIVKELTEKIIQEAIESYAEEDAFWLKIYAVADHGREVFDMDKINQALKVTK
ncbi:hypothetical protein M3629_13220 [Paenibacillus polysaccharolyticus]|uniref:hypothetical protein n=1 Tax=Paenibacillus polysaccharolyticus TaxID=582692 RepID=UPI00203CDC9C|nr:hypothetical protein [Paenibacillus polysaccharolyticus]MCM3133750.1 hypothetical protein [Paenibacillus polysaccharolyticus]